MNSFLNQITSFDMEILIHDDASTDGTAAILESYEKRSKHILPLIQKNNKFSTGIRAINPLYNFPRARGKYIALCEGDDYWGDVHKIQRQVAEMEAHPEVSISFHPARVHAFHSDQATDYVGWYGMKKKIVHCKDVILGGGGFMPTSTMMLRQDRAQEITKFFQVNNQAPVGDFFIQIIAANPNGALYIPDITSDYSMNSAGSWTSSMRNPKLRYEWAKKIMPTIETVKEKFSDENQHYLNKIMGKELIRFGWSCEVSLEWKKDLIRKYRVRLNLWQKLLWILIFRNKYYNKLRKCIKSVMLTIWKRKWR